MESPLSPMSLPLLPKALPRTPKGPLPRVRKSLWPLLIAAACLALPAWLLPGILSAYPRFLDAVTVLQGRFFGQASAMLAGLFPFSIAELLIYVLPPLLLFLLIRGLVRVFLKRMSIYSFMNGICTLALAAATLYAFFAFGWGLNYRRSTLASELGLDRQGFTSAQLAALYSDLVHEANACRRNLPEDSAGVFDPGDKTHIIAQVPLAYAELGKSWPRFNRPLPRVKPVLSSQAMSYAGISGIYFPFTNEANVNIDMPKVLLYAVAAHETAHLAGIAPEDEANFAAYAACKYSSDLAMRYSGDVLALIYVGNALYSADQDAFSAIHAELDDMVIRDLWDYNEYWKQFEGPVQEQSNKLNDNYLKQNGQEDGVKSYGRMIDLILAWEQY